MRLARLRGGLVVALVAGLVGCATFNQRCEYHADGTLERIRTRSTVFGTGETEMVSASCADVSYATLDTGISDNGKDTVLGLGKLAAAGASGGGTIAAEGLVERMGE